MEDKPLGFATLAVHADREEEKAPDMAPPIHVTTNYAIDNPDGLLYSRYDTPSRKRAEKLIGVLEGGGHGVLYSSGQAATVAVATLLKPKVVAIPKGYHGTHQVFEMYEGTEIVGIEETAKLGKGDIIWLETPTNPTCEIYDIQHYAEIAHKVGAYLAVDSTFASPVLQRPLLLGADFVYHSCSKYLGGHSDILMGALIVKDEATAKKLKDQRSVQGNTPGSLETFLLIRSLRTLSLRVPRQSSNAKILAEALAAHEKIAVVHHPSIPSHSGHELAKKQLSAPHSPPCFSVELHSEEAAKAFVKNLKLFTEASSLGGVESTIDRRYRYDKTISPALLRISVGIEDPEDLVDDVVQALAKI